MSVVKEVVTRESPVIVEGVAPGSHRSTPVGGPPVLVEREPVVRRVTSFTTAGSPVIIEREPVVYRELPPSVGASYVQYGSSIHRYPPVQTIVEPPLVVPVSPAVLSQSLVGRKVDIIEHERVVRGLEQRIADLNRELNNQLSLTHKQQADHISFQERFRLTENQLQARLRELEERLQQTGGLHSTLETLRHDNIKMAEQIRHLEGRNQDGLHLQNHLAQLTDKCGRLAAESRQIDGELQAALRARDAALQERDGLARELSILEKDLNQGAAGVRAVKSQMQVRISELEAELQELVATLRARDAEVRDLTAQMRAQERAAVDLERLKADNIALIREVDRSADEIRHLEIELRELARLRQELAELRAENERLLANVVPRAPAQPILGLEIKMLDDAAGNRDCVVVVHTVLPHGPADLAGIRPGDVLKEWDGVLLDSKSKFQRLVDQSPPGSRVIFTVVRGKSVHDIPVVVGAAGAGSGLHNVRRVQSDTQVDNVVQDVHPRGTRLRGPSGRRYYE